MTTKLSINGVLVKNFTYIGHVAIFYLPLSKLKQKILDKIHNFLINNFEGYTQQTGQIQGFYFNKKLHQDIHERFEVSFDGRENIRILVNFLSKLSKEIEEESIYLRMGYKSWLVTHD